LGAPSNLVPKNVRSSILGWL